MHLIPHYQTTVTLFSREGDVWVYPSKQAALKALGRYWIAENVRREFCSFAYREWGAGEFASCDGQAVYQTARYIMRDDAGEPLTAVDFPAPPRPRRYRLLDWWNGEGPVPGIGRPRGGHYFRHIRTTQARRQAQRMEEGEVAPRARRNLRNLPNAWDDFGVAAREDRSWKRHRRTQWKP